MRNYFLTQATLEDLDLSTDGNTDTIFMSFEFNGERDLQIVRSPIAQVGNPLLTFQISNDGVNWSDWEIVGFIFKDDNHLFEFERTKSTFFRIKWLSNSSTGTFKANFNLK